MVQICSFFFALLFLGAHMHAKKGSKTPFFHFWIFGAFFGAFFGTSKIGPAPPPFGGGPAPPLGGGVAFFEGVKLCPPPSQPGNGMVQPGLNVGEKGLKRLAK